MHALYLLPLVFNGQVFPHFALGAAPIARAVRTIIAERFLLPGDCRLYPIELLPVYLRALLTGLLSSTLYLLLLLFVLVLFLVSGCLSIYVHFRLLHVDILQGLLLLEHVLAQLDVQGCSSGGLNMRLQEADRMLPGRELVLVSLRHLSV